MPNNTQKQEILKINFDSICDDIINNNALPQHPSESLKGSEQISDFQEYAIPIINKMKTTNPLDMGYEYDKPGYITTDQLVIIIELRHKYAEQVRFNEFSKQVIYFTLIILSTLICVFFGLHKINII